jgi:hypothetical protein
MADIVGFRCPQDHLTLLTEPLPLDSRMKHVCSTCNELICVQDAPVFQAPEPGAHARITLAGRRLERL